MWCRNDARRFTNMPQLHFSDFAGAEAEEEIIENDKV